MNSNRQNSKLTIRAISPASNSPGGEFATEIIVPDNNGQERRSRFSQQRSSRGIVATSILYLLRLSILGVGLSALAGTILTAFDPTPFLTFVSTTWRQASCLFEIKDLSKVVQLSSEPKKQETANKPLGEPSSGKNDVALVLSKEELPLKKKLQTVAAKYPKLQPGAFFVDLDNGAYVDLGGETVFSAASTIKIPVLVAFLEAVDQKKAYLGEDLTMTKDVIGSGSGDMQYQQVGKKFSALETATKMIVISDNTATNMLIVRLGGKEVLNKKFQQWGLKSTVINNPLPDLEGTNTTSPRDLAYLLDRVNKGQILSLKSRDRMLEIMQQTKTRTLLPQGLEEDAIIAHKTGDIGTVLGDAGIIDMPSGKRYIGSVLVKRPHNDIAGRMIIQEMSKTVYQHFKWYAPRPVVKNTPSPSVNPTATSTPTPMLKQQNNQPATVSPQSR